MSSELEVFSPTAIAIPGLLYLAATDTPVDAVSLIATLDSTAGRQRELVHTWNEAVVSSVRVEQTSEDSAPRLTLTLAPFANNNGSVVVADCTYHPLPLSLNETYATDEDQPVLVSSDFGLLVNDSHFFDLALSAQLVDPPIHARGTNPGGWFLRVHAANRFQRDGHIHLCGP